MHSELGRHDEAEVILRDDLEVLRRVLGPEHPMTLKTMVWLSSLYHSQGRSEEARSFEIELLKARKSAAERSDPSARPKNRYAWELLTSTSEDLRDPEEALKFALKANEMTGYENPGYLDTLALAYQLSGQIPRAIETQKKALSFLPENAPGRDGYEERLAEFEAALGN